MKITFVDPVGWDYTVKSPLTEPLGGTQSALCYLAVELARRGHDVALVNHIAAPAVHDGVRHVPWEEGATGEALNQADVVIVSNTACGRKMRDAGVRPPLILWTGHAHDQEAVQDLRRGPERDAWTGFAFVSRWAQDNYVRAFALAPERTRVLHNGIAPPFAAQDAGAPWFTSGAAPVLVYTSTPFRGLHVLLAAFPAIRAGIPDCRLRVYSNMSIYRIPPDRDQFRAIYDVCRNVPGVEYIGSIGQAQLAAEISSAAAIAYPSTFAETFCIAAAEAMSVGATLITTRLGALPEIFAPFAHMTDVNSDWQKLAEAYAALAIDVLAAAKRDPAAAAKQRQAQIEFIRARYTWPTIAPQWLTWLEQVAGG